MALNYIIKYKLKSVIKIVLLNDYVSYKSKYVWRSLPTVCQEFHLCKIQKASRFKILLTFNPCRLGLERRFIIYFK